MKKHQKIVRKNKNNETQTIYHLNDGRFCYYDPITDAWFWLLMANNNQSFVVSNDAGTYESNNHVWQTVTIDNVNLVSPTPDQISEMNIIDLNNSSTETIYHTTCDDADRYINSQVENNSNNSDHNSHHSYDYGSHDSISHDS
jgi:hypothetical protein